VTAVGTDDLTLHKAAELLGVHYMTVYRYVRLGVLPALKVGGSWRVTAADVARVNEHGASAYPVVAGADVAEAAAPVAGRRRAPWSLRLEARLVAGDAAGAWSVVEAALAAGSSVDEIYLDVVSPAMRRIGQRWADGELDIAVEHRATGIVFRLLGRLGPRLVRRGRPRGTVVVGAPEGERHSLAATMVADLLRADGWEVFDLGADLPTESFVHSVKSTPGVVAVGVSVTLAEHLPKVTELSAALRVALPEVLVVAGGEAVSGAEQARSLGAEWADSPATFLALLAVHAGNDAVAE